MYLDTTNLKEALSFKDIKKVAKNFASGFKDATKEKYRELKNENGIYDEIPEMGTYEKEA